MNTAFFNMIIRDNLEQTQDDFSPGDVRAFDQESVRFGTDPDCDCPVSGGSDNPPRIWFRIDRMADARHWQVIPPVDDDTQVFVNTEKTPLTSPRNLISGDTLRVGHVTFRFQRGRSSVPLKRKKDYFSISAKVALACIFSLELGLVFWLPQKLRDSKLLARSVMSQRVMRELDDLRRKSRRPPETAAASALPGLTKALVAREVDSLSHYVRDQQNNLTTEQWRGLYADLAPLNRLLNHADSGHVGAPLPAFNDQAAITAILKKHHDKQ
ncbi:MAG: FHA domain-containing protein [Lentisphaeria bacterium]|nr:FHA domain-containing protein [Lentisphaeria bacterium]